MFRSPPPRSTVSESSYVPVLEIVMLLRSAIARVSAVPSTVIVTAVVVSAITTFAFAAGRARSQPEGVEAPASDVDVVAFGSLDVVVVSSELVVVVVSPPVDVPVVSADVDVVSPGVLV